MMGTRDARAGEVHKISLEVPMSVGDKSLSTQNAPGRVLSVTAWFRQQPCFGILFRSLLKAYHARTRYWCTVWVTDAALLAMFEFP